MKLTKSSKITVDETFEVKKILATKKFGQLYVYKYERKVKPKKFGITISDQGFVFEKDLPKSPCLPKKRIDNIFLGRQSYLDKSRDGGWHYHDTMEDDILKNPFDEYDKTDKDVFPIRWAGDCHMLFSLDNRPFPVRQHFDYIGTGIDNVHYNLEKLEKILVARNDIEIIKRRRQENNIQQIPYYNQDGGRYETIEFYWKPKLKEYRKVWKECLKSKEYQSTVLKQNTIRLDILKIKSACIKPYFTW